ncbi:MAG: hypothetical protein J0H01_37975 [Rhizobiales bacterium]|nr:hypothetical protein [Hyphomicrobiales bacterium]
MHFLLLPARRAANSGKLPISIGDPKAPAIFDRRSIRCTARAYLGQKREHVDHHGIVQQLAFIGDDLAQRQELRLVVAGEVEACCSPAYWPPVFELGRKKPRSDDRGNGEAGGIRGCGSGSQMFTARLTKP